MKKSKYKYREVIEQKYTGNNCKFSGGFVDNHPVDSMYIRLEKDGEEPTIIYLRPDEVACIGWICTGILWSKEMGSDMPGIWHDGGIKP